MPRTPPQTKPGTQKLSDLARLVVAPTGITSTGWPSVEKCCREKLGIQFDDWQHGAGRLILAKRADGNLAAMVDGVGMSLPRQVGKTYLLAAVLFALCILNSGLLVIWSAHHARTHTETFLSMQGFAKRPRVKAYVRQVFTGSGTEEIRFHNGSRILFGARERGFGRGIPGVDALVFDEAQILSDRALANMLATMNTSRFGLALFIGTPPRPEDASESFERMRLDATSGRLTDGAWIEFGAERGAGANDRKAWAKANPSYPLRTPAQSMLRLQRKLTPEDWLREGLGIWDDPDAATVLDLRKWASLANPDAPEPSQTALVIDVSPDRKWSSLGLAGDGPGSKTLLMVKHRPGMAWVAGNVAAMRQAGVVSKVALHPGGQAGALIPELTAAGVEFDTLTTREMGQATAAFIEGVAQGRFVHLGQPELDAAVANATTRFSGEAELWDRRDRSVDISPVVACSTAAFLWTSEPAYDVLDSIG